MKGLGRAVFAIAVFLPLIGAAVAGLFGRLIGDRASQYVTCGALIGSAAISVLILYEVALGGEPRTIVLFSWMTSGTFEVVWALRFDQLAAVMVFVVTVVSALRPRLLDRLHAPRPVDPAVHGVSQPVHLLHAGAGDGDNLLQLFFGWEGVGLCSYFLIGFWYRPAGQCRGDQGLHRQPHRRFRLRARHHGRVPSVRLDRVSTIFAAAPDKAGATIAFLGYEADALTVLCILLFIGAMGKSAQLGLHTWLPDAMEGPTPVSALIHAATMVTAGVFLVARMSPLFEYSPVALTVVVVIGAATAFFAATVGLCQNDIKRVIAYSTCSQLGYMFFACGVSAYSAGIFHLMTHAFFKALLFLGAGSVIHAMSSEQDMRKMGGLYTLIPLTYGLMWVGSPGARRHPGASSPVSIRRT